jgi:tRNA A37 threonylcarbamoyladenosine modification protein TsaB
LAFAEEKPLVGVSGFEALARIANAPGLIAAWVDAWRGEVFAALYEGDREIRAPVVSRPEALLESLRGRPTLFVGDGALVHGEIIRRMMGESARFANPLAPPLAGMIALLAAVAPPGDHSPHAIRPLYIRRTDAELAQDARSHSTQDAKLRSKKNARSLR